MMTHARSGIEVLLAAARSESEMPPAGALLGWEAISIEPGRVGARFQARADFCNGMGSVQGGFLAAMLDDSMGASAVHAA